MNRTIGGQNRAIWVFVLVVLGVALAGATTTADSILYVDSSAAPGGDGSTWTTAYTDLQDALAAAQTPSLTSTLQIRVAAGIYTPGDTQDDSFLLHDHVELYGGYPVHGGTRDVAANVTILSGDIGTQGDASDNCFHVVKSSGNDSSAVLDGFTVTGGYDDSSNGTGGGMVNDGSSPTITNCIFSDNNVLNYGGGMYNTSGSSPTVTDCTFTDNYAGHSTAAGTDGRGGGMCNDASSPQVTNCTFSWNEALLYGGGMCNKNSSSPTITDCTFSSNTALVFSDGGGGGMYNDSSSPTVTDCTFTGNSAGTSSDGGGLCNWDSQSTISDCTFTGNTAGSGGGMFVSKTLEDYAITVGRCTFDSNSATYDGGGICARSVDLVLEDCVVAGNSAAAGGGMHASTCNLTLTNVVVSGNLAEGDAANNGLGGAVYITGYSGVAQTLTNVTFSGNRAANSDPALYATGGALYTNYSEPDIRNCIFWNNEDSYGIGTLTASVGNDGGGMTPTFTHSLIQGVGITDGVGWDNTAGTNGGGNLDLDPGFVTPVNPGDAPTMAGNLRLQSGSPAIDAGDNSFVTAATDLDGGARIVDGNLDGTATVDLGAHEYMPHGDVNGDGVINILDVRLCLQIAEGVIPGTGMQRQRADVNGDGQVTLADAQLLAGHVAGIARP